MAELRWGDGLTTWYEVAGEGGGGRAPVVVCHGGPGATHDYVRSIANLARDGRQVVLYDQVGNGRSQHLPDAPADFWTVELFRRELHALVDHLGWRGGYHVVGQSWGGMLAMEHALERPAGLRSIVVADSPASMTLWVAEANRLRAELPADVQEALTRHEAAGTTDDPAYHAAMDVFYRRHVCRLDPWPDEVLRSFAQMEEDPTVYGTMNGPSEFHVIGTIRDWDITERLPEIAVPTLLVSGRHDEATPRIVGEIRDRIPGSEWVLFEQSSHMPHVEEPEAFLEAVGAFLERADRRAA
ncbi:MAG: Proline iminopeptidase [uncultured Solirubrobacteraceae bacterium]|uniref:Proline iminopeptidase n=1 Tax=uncultured Solirubrobacteraceae bacterium TaxID=1162706 RepID=A0A6J4SIY2_9ACTN|nr:MAG: Proline iminopeptidase [uncultured Solirubrobacteraceae bacterium]